MLYLLPLHAGDGLDALEHGLFSLAYTLGLALHEQYFPFQSSPALDGLQFFLIVVVLVLLGDAFLIMVFHFLEGSQFVLVLFTQGIEVLPHLPLDVRVSFLQLSRTHDSV